MVGLATRLRPVPDGPPYRASSVGLARVVSLAKTNFAPLPARRITMRIASCAFRIAATTCVCRACRRAAPAPRGPTIRKPSSAIRPTRPSRWSIGSGWGETSRAEGITGDLEVLKAAGFGGTTMCNLGDVCTPWPYEIGHGLNPDMVPYVSHSWWKLVRHAAAESRAAGARFRHPQLPRL